MTAGLAGRVAGQRPRGWPVTRALAACAALAALFLMHGTPAAAGGCHGGAIATTTASGTASTDAAMAMPTGADHAAASSAPGAMAAPPAAHIPPAAGVATGGVAAAPGMLCVSAPPRHPLTVTDLAAVAGIAAVAGRPRRHGAAVRASPRRANAPPGHPFLRLCVSRT
jgi:hypothetical protein